MFLIMNKIRIKLSSEKECKIKIKVERYKEEEVEVLVEERMELVDEEVMTKLLVRLG